MRKFSIGVRLTLWYLAIFAIAQLVFGAGLWLLMRHHLYDLADDDLESQVKDLQNFLEAQKKDAPLGKMQEEFAEAYVIEHAGDYLQVYAGNGNWVYQSDFMKAHRLAPIEPDQIQELSLKDHWMAGKPLRFATQRIESGSHRYTVQTGLLLDDVVDTLSVFKLYLLMFAPLLFVSAAAGGYWLSRRALAPVDAIVQSARTISGTNLQSRLEKLDTGDELQRLSDTLNEMLGRIERAFQRVTQFTADASHELRTPVSLIRTEAELALRRSREEAQYRESLEHILREAERTTVVIEEMLLLARSDSGHELLKMHPVNIGEALRGVIEGWRQVATVCNLEFRDSLGEGELFVTADESSLIRVVNILLDNAFKYTPPPGTVTLALEEKDDKALITVQDSGAGIAEEELEKIFERFYRVDKARSRRTPGAGLGLSIARWIVQQHGGTMSVESAPGQGSKFRVSLPTIAAPARSPLTASRGLR
jgi:heavy metal sensor kinase